VVEQHGTVVFVEVAAGRAALRTAFESVDAASTRLGVWLRVSLARRLQDRRAALM